MVQAERIYLHLFPDLQPQFDYPSCARLCHDGFAIDDRSRFKPYELVGLMVEGGGAMDPDATVDAAAYRNVLDCFAEVLIDAYQRSSTFRRLFNRAADTTLRETRWLLAPDHAFGTTVTNAQRIAAGNRAVIGLNLDAQSDYAVVETYVCDGPDHPFSIRRSYVHEMIHALTGLVDDDDGHPRGPVVEYENLVMKQMGDRSPARTAYRHIAQADCGDAAELDFAAVDFGDAFGN